MQAEFPFFYNIEGLRPRERNTRTHTMLRFVQLDLREVDGVEAPVGVRIDNGVGAEELRFFEGRWWAKDRAIDGAEACIRTETGMCGADMEPFVRNESLFALRHYSSWRVKEISKRAVQTVESLGLRAEIGNDYEKSLDRLTAAVAENAIAIDGVLYTSVPEPFFAFSMEDDSEAAVRVVFGLPKHDEYSRHKNRTLVFAIDGLEDLKASVEDYEETSGKEALQAATATYFHGDLSRASKVGTDLYYAAYACVRRGSHKISDWPKAAVMAWVDLRDSVDAVTATLKAKEPVRAEGLDAIVDALAEYRANAAFAFPFAHVAAQRWRFRTIQDPTPESPAP